MKLQAANKNNSTRIPWIDMAKGYGIICVLIAHYPASFLRDEISTFHMPLFFFLSGCVFQAYKYDWKSFLKRKVQTLIVPYFCLGLVIVLFDWLFYWCRGIYTAKDFWFSLLQLLVQRRFCTIWFLTCLFLTELIFYALVHLCRDRLPVIGGIIAVAAVLGLFYYRRGFPPLFWNLDTCAEALPFFFAGYLLQKKQTFFSRFFTLRPAAVILFILCLPINLLCGHESAVRSGRGLEMFNSSYGFAPLTYLAAFAGIFAVILFSSWFTLRPVSYIGRNSMIYFAWHQSILMPLITVLFTAIGLPPQPDFPGHPFSLAAAVLLQLGILTIMDYILRHSRLKFMLGIFRQL